MDQAEMISLFRQASGAKAAGICPTLPLRGKKEPGPKSTLRGMRSVIVGIFPYYCGPSKGNLSLYARGRDYHGAILARLEKAEKALKEVLPARRFVCGCDASPIDEVRAALGAGLGVRGDNGLFISETYGSFVFIGTLATDTEFSQRQEYIGRCLHCGACRRACPTGVLGGEGIKSERCLSAITQKKGPLTGEEQICMQTAGMAWGCDACQLCCPYNRSAEIDPMPEFRTDLLTDLPEELLSWDGEEAERFLSNRAFAWRGRETLERNIRILNKKTGNDLQPPGEMI